MFLLGKAAKLAGVTKREFLEELANRKVPGITRKGNLRRTWPLPVVSDSTPLIHLAKIGRL
ncbi:UPF0175 family protein [Thermococcus sp. 2319x1]|uniref:UPF0175 family protein n=1 Tax=Thermococcus sp. 2319x1 TaxID=1674923 RepID=UPI001EEFD1D8|nr:UPF0175 family protein [Thermococcus sp. 2319x1]